MKTINVTNARQLRDINCIELTISDPLTGKEEKRKFQDIRGGISWPTTKAPAYFCIIGQEYLAPDYMGNSTQPGTKILLAEYESEALHMLPFYEKLLDRTNQMQCRNLYAELAAGKISCGYQSDLIEHARSRGNSLCRVDHAFDADDFILGLSRIKGSIDNSDLIIPDDSIVIDQLRDITRQDLEEHPDQVFHAINGLRHVISSFFRYPPTIKRRKQFSGLTLERTDHRTHMSN